MAKIQEQASELLEEIRTLSELNGENPFKTRAYERAYGVVGGCSDLEHRARAGTLTELEGIGKGIAEILTEFILKGKSSTRDELKAKLPEGLLDLVQVPGLGPKKAKTIIEELGVKSVGELEYACRENRLTLLKGFGEKIQAKILEGIQQLKSNADRARLIDVLELEETLLKLLRKAAGEGVRVESTGPLRRRLEILDQLDFLVGTDSAPIKSKAEKALSTFRSQNKGLIATQLHFSNSKQFGFEWVRTTSTEENWKALGSPALRDEATEEKFFETLKIEFIPSEMRETAESAVLAKKGTLKTIVNEEAVQGVFHNHTRASDGTGTLEDMVLGAKERGYRYIGISDHSQSAFYANGLKADALREQEKEVRKVQEKYPEIQVFWGVESDILADGELDYPSSILKKFDFVIASVHSRFKMDKAQMTERMVKAIRNPATRFIGHLTGRLLLGRPGYELDMETVAQEAAQHDVAIEINANPARLDIDWRWGPLLRKNKTMVSINPDAHSVEGLSDTRFGVTVARKALLPTALVVNTRSTQEVSKWLARK